MGAHPGVRLHAQHRDHLQGGRGVHPDARARGGPPAGIARTRDGRAPRRDQSRYAGRHPVTRGDMRG